MTKTNARSQVDELATKYIELRAVRDRADKELKETSAELKAAMESLGQSSRTTGDGAKVTLVERSNTTFDADRLKKRVGTQMWNKITTRTLDRGKLDAYVKSGEVSPKDLAAATIVNPTTSYIKVTGK